MAGIAELGVRASVLGLTSFRAGMATMKREAATAHSSFGAFGQGMSRTNGILNSFTQSIIGAGTSMRFLGNQMTNIGLRATLLLSAPFLAGTAAIIGTGAAFEDEMTRIITLVGVSRSVVEDWASAILDMAPALGALPVELAKTLFVVTSAGIREGVQSVSDLGSALEVTQEAAKSAAIGLGETKEIARILTAVVQTYGEDLYSAARANEILVATVREGNFEASQLATTLGRVIGIAQVLGVSFEELAAFIATFTRTGVGPDVAVTSLRATLSALIKPTKKAEDQLAALGISMADVRAEANDVDEKLQGLGLRLEDFQDAANAGGHGLAEVLFALDRALDSNVESIANVIGSQRGLAAVFSLIGGFAEQYKEVLNEITDSHGIVEESFEEVQKTLSFGWKVLKSQIDVVGQRMAVAIIPVINEIIAKIAPLLSALADFAKTHQGLVRVALAIGAIVSVVGPLLIVSGFLISSWGTVIQFAGQLIKAVLFLGGGLSLLAGPLIAVGAALAAFSVAIAAAIPRMGKFLNTSTQVTSRVSKDWGHGIIETFEHTDTVISKRFESMSTNMLNWGKNVVIQFAKGLIQGAIFVVQALSQIASVITRWLSPGSPPKLLPDLTDWGAGAMQAYMEGWDMADFDVFNKASNSIESFLRSLSDKAGDTVLAARKQLTKIVDEFRRTGEISAASFANLDNALGFSSQRVHDYIRDLAALERASEAVAAAQENLKNIQKSFNDALTPIDKRLAEIDAIAEKIRRDRRRKELEGFIADPSASQEAKDMSVLELEQLDLKDQRDALLLQQSAAEDSAQAAVSAAQAEQDRLTSQVAMHEQVLGFFEKNNSLVNEMKESVSALADTIGDVTEALGSWDPGGDFDFSKTLDEAIENAKKKIQEYIDTALKPLEEKWKVLMGLIDQLALKLAILYIYWNAGVFQNKILAWWAELKAHFWDLVAVDLWPIISGVLRIATSLGNWSSQRSHRSFHNRRA